VSILSYPDLKRLLPKLVEEPDESLLNGASLDIRIGRKILVEVPGQGCIREISIEDDYYHLAPGEFILAETYERLSCPDGYAFDLRLKSTRARGAYDHALAFFFDPGWQGVGTFEIRNNYRWTPIPIWCGMKFAQIVVQTLTSPAGEHAYQGRYQGAETVQAAKEALS
jgi:dCTP deaminase